MMRDTLSYFHFYFNRQRPTFLLAVRLLIIKEYSIKCQHVAEAIGLPGDHGYLITVAFYVC